MNECSDTRGNQSFNVATYRDVISRAFRSARTYPMACHDINGPGISGPGGPFMLSQMAPLDHLCQNINGPGKT